MSGITPEMLMALPPEYFMESNPASRHLQNTSVAVIVIATVVFILFVISTHMTHEHSPVEMYFLMPVAYLGVMGIAVIGIRKLNCPIRAAKIGSNRNAVLVQIGGLGRHRAYHILNSPDTEKKFLQLQSATELIYMVCVTFPKIAFLTLYLRIFTDRLVRALSWVIIAALLLFFVTGIVVSFTVCRPYAYRWNNTIHGSCGNVIAYYRWASFPSIITDVFILIIPIPSIWKMHLAKSKKIGVLVTFMVGSL